MAPTHRTVLDKGAGIKIIRVIACNIIHLLSVKTNYTSNILMFIYKTA